MSQLASTMRVRVRNFVFIPIALVAASPRAFADTPWETYLKSPSPAAAATVTLADYSAPDEAHRKLEQDLSILEYEVAAGDVEATRLAVRLLAQFANSAHIAESLDAIIGRSIRPNPSGYLRAIKDSRDCIGVRPTGDLFVDRDDADKAESRARAAALRTVTDPALTKRRNECLAMLEPSGGK